MYIQKINSTTFEEKYQTSKILELTTRRIFDNDGMQGFIDTLKKVHGNVPRYTGHQGYRRYAAEAGNKIIEKYPIIAEATKRILEITEKEPNILPKELRERIQPIIKNLDNEIDIVI